MKTKYLEINLFREVSNLSSENCQTLKKEVKKIGKELQCLWIGKYNKHDTITERNLQSQWNFHWNSNDILHTTKKLRPLNPYGSTKYPKLSNSTKGEKNNARGIIISDSNYSNYNKFIVPKTKWLLQKQTFWATEWNRGPRNRSTHLEACNFGNVRNMHQKKKTTNNFEETKIS